ncbi:MAG: CPBP family intramembrane metalloprotease [Propionibacteriaceae bacterium]|nr:CPBP family intramembrane metalloprotease [Propionibacteriaceae bacterium]
MSQMTDPFATQYAPVQPKLFQPTELKDYMRFYQVPARRWWWALIVLVAFLVAAFFVLLIVSIIAMVIDPELMQLTQGMVGSPSVFLFNNVLIVSLIPVAILFSWLFYRQGFGWLMSVVGRMRWSWFGLALGVLALGYVVIYFIDIVVLSDPREFFGPLELKPYTWFMIGAILLTTPLQSASEEIVVRGFFSRILTALIPHKLAGLVVAAVVSTTCFMLMHMAEDLWLNIYYVTLGFMLWWLVYRTGGLEASIAFHVVNNMFSMSMLPFMDMTDMFDRSSGVASPLLLVDLFGQLVLVLLLDFLARRRGLVRESAPAAAWAIVSKPQLFLTNLTAEPPVTATEQDLPRITTTFRELAPTWGSTPDRQAPAVPQIPTGGFGSSGLLTADRARPWEELPENQPPEDPHQ